jgi:hypothetical protein
VTRRHASRLPEVAVTVLSGSHFPHLAEPAGIAALLNAR